MLSFVPLLQELASNGHNITIFNADMKPAGDFGKNIAAIDVIDKPDEAAAAQFAAMLFTFTAHSYIVPLGALYNGMEFNNLVLRNPDLFCRIFDTKYDLVIVDEFFSIHGMVSALFLNKFEGVPYVVFSATQTTSFFQSNLALGRNYGSQLSLFTDIPESRNDKFDPKNFLHRVFSVVEAGLEDFLVNKVAVNFLQGPGILGLNKEFDFFTFAEKSSGILSDHFDRIGEIHTGSDWLSVGAHCPEITLRNKYSMRISKDLKKFIEDPESKGTIVVSFGTTVSWTGAPDDLKYSLLESFEDLKDYRIVGSFSGDFPVSKSKNIKILDWIPQADLLNHPKTKLFLTHGGLKSLKESICAGVPVAIMPIVAEQAYNAKFVLKLKIGKSLKKFKISKKIFLNSFKKILENPIYIKNILKTKNIILDRILPSVHQGVHKIQKIMKMKKKYFKLYDFGQKMLLKRKGMYLDRCRYWGLDLGGLILVIIMVLK